MLWEKEITEKPLLWNFVNIKNHRLTETENRTEQT